MSSVTEQTEPALESYQDAQAILERMAHVQAPAPADPGLRELTSALAEVDVPDGDPGNGGEEESESRRAQALLRKAEARYRALVEQIPAVSFLAPLDGSTSELYVSPQIEALLGFTAEEWLDDP